MDSNLLATQSYNIKDIFKEWITLFIGAIAVYRIEVVGVFILFCAFFTADFVVDIIASRLRDESIESYKLRWSFVKTFSYLGTFAFTFAIGICIDAQEIFIEILKVVIYAATYIECVSIIENLLAIFPNNIFFKFLHYMLSVKWVKRVSGMADFFKETGKDKNTSLK